MCHLLSSGELHTCGSKFVGIVFLPYIFCVFLSRIPIFHVALISNKQFLLKCLYILCGMKLKKKKLRLLLKI